MKPPYRKEWPKPAVIYKEDAVAKFAEADDGYVAILMKGSLNATSAPVGSRGKLVWLHGVGFALPFFEMEKKEGEK